MEKNSAKKQEISLLIDLMLEKSKEAFLLSIELYNKPTISLRTEGFLYFSCLAWELLLKAKLLTEGKSIYYKVGGESTNKTISLSTAIKRVMTNDSDLVRKNLEIISGVRNFASHLIIPEYANELNDLFLASVKNYQTKLVLYFPDKSDLNLKNDFLTIHLPTKGRKIDCSIKYGKIVGKNFRRFVDFTKHYYMEHSVKGVVPEELAISYEIRFKKINSEIDANLTIAKKGKNATAEYITIVEHTDPKITHPYSTKQVITKISDQLSMNSLKFNPYTLTKNTKFTSDAFNLFVRHFRIKDDLMYCYGHYSENRSLGFTYSPAVVQFIVDQISNDPDILIKIKQKKD